MIDTTVAVGRAVLRYGVAGAAVIAVCYGGWIPDQMRAFDGCVEKASSVQDENRCRQHRMGREGKMRQIRNAKIVSTFLGHEDHGILSCMLNTESGPISQGFGGYALDDYDPDRKKRVPSTSAGFWVQRILETLDVDSWEKVKGQLCRVDADATRVYGIGNIVNEAWFYPGNEIEERTRSGAR